MKLRYFQFVVLVALVPLVTLAEFNYDNEITGEPDIECGYGVAHFNIRTSKDRPSQVFVKGNSGNPDCVFHNTGNVTIELTKCNIRRKREINPAGIAYQMTVIVQLHPLFVTKRDRAYRLECVYSAPQQQRVGFEFGVSDLTTQSVSNDAPIPTCNYQVHRDSPNGPIVQYSKVGEVLYHVWNCKSDMYAMLLSHCKVVDGKGTEYQLIDTNGCSTDTGIFPQITYSKDLSTAMVQTTAFNFPDRNNMYFSCKIRLCIKSDNCQAVTPPRCNGRSTTEATIELAGHGDATTLTDDLDNEQLISSTTAGVLTNEESTTQESTTEATESTTTSVPSSTRRPTTTSQPTTTSTQTTTTTSGNAAFFIPSDFPRPAFLPQDDGGSGEGASDIPEVDAWMVSEEPQQRDQKSNETSPPPVQLLKKAKTRSESAASSTTSTRQPSRQQRDATPMPKRMVDFDITAPEMTILEDYQESNSNPALQPQRQVYRDLSPQSNGRGICFSPAALICAIGLVALLCITVVVVLFKTQNTTTHKFY
ncbi:Zona pellucida domain-containing protein [Aphelenchoides besseyi]|nr:Zona pellucida domain-containing protein [Aphelenchoides besseyi]